MSDLNIEVLTIAQELEASPDGRPQFLHELLFFPEFSSFGEKLLSLQSKGKSLATKVIESLPSDHIASRQSPDDFETETVTILVSPTKRHGLRWREAVELKLPVITWSERGEAKIAYVPALDIEVVASNAARLPAMLESHIQFAVRRKKVATSLLRLARAQRG